MSTTFPRERKTGRNVHTLINVYCEFLLQICRDYPGLPDPRTLNLTEIRFFYEGLRVELEQRTKPRKSP